MDAFRPHVCVLWLVTAAVIVPLAAPGSANACTLWGAAGNDAAGGTIIAKNRDWAPDHVQVLKMHHPAKGHPYFGLYAEGGDEPGLKCGVNAAGLTVITASASSIPKAQRASQPGKRGILRTLLTECASCDEVQAKAGSIFPTSRAVFLMIADRRKILLVEVGLEGKYALQARSGGTVTHTNHYLQPNLAQFNIRIGKSSATRLARVDDLMRVTPRPCGLDSLAAISRDQHDGPDNSLWRTGARERTLASWMVENPPQGAATLRVVLANPGQPEETHRWTLDPRFWAADAASR